MKTEHAFGTQLRRARRALGLTQQEVAERAGVSTRAISDLERGASHSPHADTVALLAEALGLQGPDGVAFVAAAGRLRGPAPLAPPRWGTASVAGAGALAPFVGRQRELALLEQHLAGQGPPVLLLAGEPGIGKTRLLHAAIPRAVAQGLQVLEGGCQRRGGQQPYAPLLGALQRYIRSRRPSQLRAELQGCAWLVRLLPELAGGPIPPLPPWHLSPEQEQRLLNEAVARFLSNVAGPAGTLLLLDDLQWASPDALALLETLARTAADVPLRVLGAYRDIEVAPQDPLFALQADLAHAGLATRRLLGPLALPEAAQLLDSLLVCEEAEDRALRERMLQRAGGVPFFVVSCAHALQQPGGREDTPGVDVPWDIGQSVRQRVAALPEGARDLVGLAAVMGRVVPRAVLTAAAARPEEELVAALDALCRARLLEDQGHDAYQFAHDLIREVVEADLGSARRTHLHRRVAEALERQAGEPAVELLAYHYARSTVQDKALLYLELAGARAKRQYAYAAAETYYRELLQRLDPAGRALEGARAREQLGAILNLTAHFAEALGLLEHAARTFQTSDDLEGLAGVLAQIGRAYAAHGIPAQGLARIQPLLEILAPCGPSPGLAALHAALAWLYLADGQDEACVAAAERAVDLARAVGDDEILLDAEVRRGTALPATGRSEEGQRVLEGAIALAETAGDLHSHFRALQNLGSILTEAGELSRARECCERALVLVERAGDRLGIMFVLAYLGDVLFLQGDWALAHTHLARAVDLSRAVGWSLASRVIRESLAQLLVAKGDPAEATRCLEEGMAGVGPSVGLRSWLRAQQILAECEVQEGRPEEALARLTPLLDDHNVHGDLLRHAAWAYLDLGCNAEATKLATRALERARARNSRVLLVDALRVAGMVAARSGRCGDAEEALQEGLSLARQIGYPYAQARLLQAYGEVLARTGQLLTARERLQEALALFRHLGARRDSQRVEQALAARSQNTPASQNCTSRAPEQCLARTFRAPPLA